MPAVLNKVCGIKFTQVDDTQQNELGIEVAANDGRTYKYIRAGAAIAVGDALHVDYAEGYNDLHPTSAASQPIAGVAHVAIADNKFGWVVVRGVVPVKAATVVAGTPGVSTATAGTLDDTAADAANALATAAGIGARFLTADGTPSAGLAQALLS